MTGATSGSGPQGIAVEADGDDLTVDAETRGDSLGEVITDLSAGHEIGDEVFHLGGKVVKAGAQAGLGNEKPASKFLGLLFDSVFAAAVVVSPAGEIRE